MSLKIKFFKEDKKIISNLEFSEIKNLVSILSRLIRRKIKIKKKLIFNIFFDKKKLHDLFFKKEFYIQI